MGGAKDLHSAGELKQESRSKRPEEGSVVKPEQKVNEAKSGLWYQVEETGQMRHPLHVSRIAAIATKVVAGLIVP